jgi:Ca2+-binding EF-hand superfamily protein
MRKVAILFVLTISLLSCNSLNIMKESSLTQAVKLLSSLSSNSTVQQVSTLFNLLDINKDSAIGTTEAIGSIEENFSTLDTDNSSNLSLTELQGLLTLLK